MLANCLPTLAVCIAAGALTLPCRGADEPKPIKEIGPAGKVTKLHTDFRFTEGPAPDKEGNLYFSDVQDAKTYKIDASGKLTVFREKSNKGNGLMVNAKGEIVCCEMESGKVVAVSPDGKDVRVIAEKFGDKRFNAPNDLVIDTEGGIYFTDPSFGAPMPLPQGKTCVYYVTPKGEVSRLIDNLPNPNGVILSPDEKTLYVIPSGQADMMSYPVTSAGKVGEGKVFCTLKQKMEGGRSGGDGLTVDTKGNLYITSQLGVQVFSPKGELLGVLEFPEQPANCAFGGKDMRTLYVTARKSVYSVPMEATGHRFATAK